MGQVYSKQYLLKALKKHGLPCSYQTLLEYEDKGIVSKPQSSLKFHNGDWRMYTQEEIDNIVAQVSAYRKTFKNDKATA